MVAIADSPTTAERLIRMGYNHVRVAHDFTNLHPPSMWANDVGTERELDDAVGVPFALVASELSREASPHVLLHALHVLQTVHDVELGLVLVGPSPDASYERALRRLVDGLRLRHVWFAGVRTGPSLTTLFRSARMCCSAGSSGVATRAPMLEAMALGVPTVVRDVAGVAPTRGALRLPPSSGPLMFVEALLLLHRDESTRASRVAAGLASVSEHHDPGRPRTIADLIAAAELAP
jgi:glycosyltransferase involved in cell wall biosynthesis